MAEHSVSLEISGLTAMWTRPDTGDAPVSYPAPTYCAVKGIFESILWSQWARVVPTKVEICRPIVYHNYSTNYGGPLRKSRIMLSGSSFQLIATVLVNVCYRLYAAVESDPRSYAMHGRGSLQRLGTTNGAHAYKEVFERRLAKGQLFYTPFLGWKEFTPDYVGPFRDDTHVCDDIDRTIPSMLITCFPEGRNGGYEPQYRQGVRITRGVMCYA